MKPALVMYAASETDANLLYATKFLVGDPVPFVQVGKRKLLVLSDLELGRGRDEADVDEVLPLSDLQKAVGKPATIGAGVSVGHRAVLHGCTIEDDCLIGMGAIVLNQAHIGAGSLIAAGAVIQEGAVIPPRSLVAGVPGKLRRELSDADLQRIRANAEGYVGLKDIHRTARG